jgi:hypothetical protein
LVAFLIASAALAAPCFLYRKPMLDAPLSLAVSTIRTSEFVVKHEAYTISIQIGDHAVAHRTVQKQLSVNRWIVTDRTENRFSLAGTGRDTPQK